jgi:nickel-dependent lactate racemase
MMPGYFASESSIMRIGIDFGLDHLELEVLEHQLVGVEHAPQAPATADVPAAIRSALESPVDFPALWRALTPDDHVAIVVDERLPRLAELLTPLLEHVARAGVAPAAITLLCSPSAARQEWIDELSDAFADVQIEVHDPANRKKLAYLATTKKGRRLYLNRTAVDADQLVVLSRREYDPLLGYGGGAGAFLPALGDEETRAEMFGRAGPAIPGTERSPAYVEAQETSWLLGAPFYLHVIEGEGDSIAHVVGGVVETSSVSERLLDDRWRLTVGRRAEVVIAALGGDPTRQSFADLANAWNAAARVVKPGGQIVLLSQAAPMLAEGAQLLEQGEEAQDALALLEKHKTPDGIAARQWAQAALQAHLYLLSGLAEETAEALFATPLADVSQVQRLVAKCDSCLVLQDAHKCLALLRDN